MALTPGLLRALQAAELEAAAAAKAAWSTRIRAVMDAIDPPLAPIELSLGLGVDAPAPPTATGARRPRTSTVSRWLSATPRNLHTLPDPVIQALIARLEAGHAVMAVARTPGIDGVRALTFAEPWEVPRLGPELDIVRFGHAPVEAPIVVEPSGQGLLRGLEVPAAGVPGAIDFSGGALEVPRKVAAPRRLGPWEIPALGLGAMRLATAGHPPEADGIAVLRRAFELGIRLVDTADSYGVDHDDMHAGERLVRVALGGWPAAERDDVIVATKAGLVRPGGRWLPDGRPDHLRAACEQSLLALGVERIDLWQLHVKDPKVPFEESLGALAEMQRAGKVRQLGLCNVKAADVWTALRVLPEGALVSVQNELSPFEPEAALEVLALTRAHGIAFLAHRALGGYRGTVRITKRPSLYAIAERHRSSAQAVVLAWLLELAPHVIPLFGATKVESVEGSVEALRLALTEEDMRVLDDAFPAVAALRHAVAPVEAPPAPGPHEGQTAVELVSEPLPSPGSEPEVVLILGMPGAGKSSLIEPYVARGYERLNRDDLGGRLDGLVPRLKNLVASGRRHLVLDNTYATRKSRAGVIAAAREAGLPVRALWLDTPLEEARWNACLRMIERHGRLLGPDEIKVASKLEANTIPPRAQHHWLETFEPPSTSEGLERIERRAFVRAPSPDTKKGLLLDVDGALRRTRSGELYPRTPEDVELLPGRREALERWLAHGWRIFFTSNQSGIHSGRVRTDMVDRAFARTIELLGLPVDDVVYCPHQAFPVACFCRKPMPGLAALLVTRHHLARPSLVVVGELQSERDFATAIGARYVAPDAFFGVASPPRRRG